MTTSAKEQSLWDSHWQSNRLSSSSQDIGFAEQSGVAGDFAKLFGTLPKGARVLDICTGNGLVLSIASRVSGEGALDLALTGVDAADIDPVKYLAENATILEGATFMGRTMAEDMPFDDAHFDVVAGLHAIEYTDWTKTAAEVARVLEPGGSLLLHIHARDGAFVAYNAEKPAQYQWLNKESGLFEAFVKAVESVWEVERATDKPDQSVQDRAEADVAAFRDKLEAIKGHYEGAQNIEDIKHCVTMVVDAYNNRSRIKDRETLEGWVAGMQRELDMTAERVEALLNSAMDSADVEKLQAALEKAGMTDVTCEAHLMPGSGAKVGWRIAGARKES